ncbi:MAG: phage major capsid protein [Clostridia bacterium]|nr:phage major capsid protein [Clostridia bacterium]
MLKQLVLQKRLDAAKLELKNFLEKGVELRTRREAFTTREAELEKAVNELTDESTSEERTAVEEAVATHEAEGKTLKEDEENFEGEKQRLSDLVSKIENELNEIQERAQKAQNNPEKNPVIRKENKTMNTRTKFFGMTIEQRDAFFARDDMKDFISKIRSSLSGNETRGVTNATVGIPSIALEVLRDNIEQYSKLMKYVTVKTVDGKARQNIIGTSPEGIWMEAAGAFNELDLELNQVEVDGYKVGGFIPVANSTLEDSSDIALGTEIMLGLAQAIGKGVDYAIVFGTGNKMPLGIIARLAQTSQPANWGDKNRPWTDLHTSHVLKLNINGTTGATFFASLIEALGVAQPNYSNGKAFWVMNRKTHIKIQSKALAFDASAALVAGIKNEMPIIGGEIVELDGMTDNQIVGGFGSVYLLAEREGSTVEQSKDVRFLQDQTVFKGFGRYDGLPVIGEAFVVVSFDNENVTTSRTFPKDYANTVLGDLIVTSAASASTSGKTVITVSGTEASGTTLGYKVGGRQADVECGDNATGFTAWNGSSELAIATGKTITVVEIDDNNRIIKAGSCKVTAKA